MKIPLVFSEILDAKIKKANTNHENPEWVIDTPMMMTRRNVFHALYAIIAIVLCSVDVVESKKNKKTKEPSSSPSSAPSTSFPSVSPSSAPTQWPSREPTKSPTLRPSASPTVLPTSVPTSRPTNKPTVSPTARPTIKPTVTPTHKPTSMPTPVPTVDSSQFPSNDVSTTQPTIAATFKWDPTQYPSVSIPAAEPDEGVIMTPSPTNQPSRSSNGRDIPAPRIQMALLLSESNRAASRDSIQEHMSSFITVLFETKTGIEALDIVSLEVEVVPSMFVKETIESGFSIKIEGMLQNTRGDMTKEMVRDKVVEYFSSYGVGDLETFLHEKSITSASVGELYVDGIVVVTGRDVDSAPPATRKQEAARPNRSGIFALLAAASGVLLVSCSIFFYRRNYGNETRSGSRSSVQQQNLMGKLQHNNSSSEHQTDNESQNSGRDISVHVNMEELEPVALNRVDSYQEYDATRLDRIISDAKSRSKKKGQVFHC